MISRTTDTREALAVFLRVQAALERAERRADAAAERCRGIDVDTPRGAVLAVLSDIADRQLAAAERRAEAAGVS